MVWQWLFFWCFVEQNIKKIVSVKPLSHYIATLLGATLCAFGHPVKTCCDLLGVVGSNLKMVKFFYATFVDFPWCCGCLARFVQQCCAWAWALVLFSSATCRNRVAKSMQHVVPNNVAICCVQMLWSFSQSLQILGQQCWDMLRWNVAFVWPGL